MIIGITGTLAAGKGTVVEFLKNKGFKHYSVRDYLLEEIKKRDLIVNRNSMVSVANELREKNSPNYITEKLYSLAKKEGENCIIESLRTPGEIFSLKNKEKFYLFSVDANRRLRYKRAVLRESETDQISFEEFVDNEEKEMNSDDPNKQNLKKCIELSDFSFENNGSIEELCRQVELVLEQIIEKKESKFLGRKDYLSWDEYFMGIAILSSQRSKDPSTQVGACIVDENKKVVGTGYNGAPRGIKDEDFPWERKGDFLNTKYAYVCHAELNAILNSTKESLNNCIMYVGLCPCNECAKAIIQSGIKKVVYFSNKYSNIPEFIAGKRLLEMAGIELIQLETKIDAIKLNFDKLKC
jgi:dCMP deaminase